jgi:hypothetical protein
MGKNGSGRNISDHISESLETIFRSKILKFLDVDPDPGFGIFMTLDPWSGIQHGKIRIRDKHPGSATLVLGQMLGVIHVTESQTPWI